MTGCVTGETTTVNTGLTDAIDMASTEGIIFAVTKIGSTMVVLVNMRVVKKMSSKMDIMLMLFEDDEVRVLMATTLESCEDTLDNMPEQQENN